MDVLLTVRQRVNLARRRIKPQFDMQNPNARLMWAIVETAIMDLAYSNGRIEWDRAILYLRGPIPHAEICGISPDWIRDTLLTLDLGV